MPLCFRQRVNARTLRDESEQVISPTQRHAPARVRAVVSFPHRPRSPIATLGAQAFQLSTAFAEGPSHQIDSLTDNVFQQAAGLNQFKTCFVSCQAIEIAMPKPVPANLDERMPRYFAQLLFRKIGLFINESSRDDHG